jgi:hypothetical protein
MEYDELHRELKRLLKQAGRVMRWFNEDKRAQLLPALMAMKALVAQPGRRFPREGVPTWEEECKKLGISADLVRKWKQRTGAEHDLRKLLGEDEYTQRKHHETMTIDQRKLQRLCEAVLNGEQVLAERLAAAYVEEYGF